MPAVTLGIEELIKNSSVVADLPSESVTVKVYVPSEKGVLMEKGPGKEAMKVRPMLSSV
jgi:hypothetical protein